VTNRVVFLDIDGPMIPYSMFLVDRMASYNRVFPAITVAVIREVCERGDAKVVFNTTHNTPFDGVPDIDVAMVNAGFPREMIHADMKTQYPQIPRGLAVTEWLRRHPEVTDWIAFDDVKFTDADNLIWINPDAGLHLEHLNVALDRWNCSQFLVL
jgi:hypothetical protein